MKLEREKPPITGKHKSVAPSDFAIIGLGRMGGNLARQALEHGFAVAGYSLRAVPPDLRKQGLHLLRNLAGLRAALKPPRRVLLYLPAGPAVDRLLEDLTDVLERGDVIADGGNSYWGDSIRRHRRLQERGIHFLDVGTSGGMDGARHGACFMVGGEARAVRRVEPLLRKLAVAGGYVHAGPPGAGHYVKLVHNGIEFGMLQAIAEGVDLLERYAAHLPVHAIIETWRHGSVIRSWLVDLMAQKYSEESGLERIPPLVEDTGEVSWLVDDALRMEVAIPVIAQSVMQLIASRDERKNSARAIAMMRQGFGGHPYGCDKAIAHERRESRVGDFVLPDATRATPRRRRG